MTSTPLLETTPFTNKQSSFTVSLGLGGMVISNGGYSTLTGANLNEVAGKWNKIVPS